ncbi:PadR family transcriptional regulator [Paracoccus sp. XHP0099]|uniref:PadR family transcriptional regulator n=2 Tax=Paracoccus marinaquae TaxID=2841926 RepID=A0ABS6AIP9_9RHOB|nr:PadR family transcriptional regulator [Paracoccus marinaquae]
MSYKSLQLLAFLTSDPNREHAGADMSRELGIVSGTLYPLLARMELEGLVSSRWEEGDPKDLGRPRRRFYRITGLGASAAARELAPLQMPPTGGLPA